MQPYKRVCVQESNIPYSFNEQDEKIGIDYSNFIQQMEGPYHQLYEPIDKQCIGAGGQGCVIKVKCKLNNEIRAMKVIKKINEDKNENFRKEFQNLKLLDHPNILKLYHSFEDDQRFYIISELCEGGTLSQYIEDHYPLKEAEVLKIMKQLISSINFAHKKNIVHRDIKPENILIDDEVTTSIKLIDWGFSGMIQQYEKLSLKCGTIHFVAPEVMEESYDQKCDIWSCGVVLYILLCNDPPFQGTDSNEILFNIKNQGIEFRYQSWKQYSTLVKDLLKRMLEKNPELRPNAQQVLEDPWFESHSSEQIPSQDFKESMIQFNGYTEDQDNNLKQSRFLQAIVLFIATELVHKDDKKVLNRIFRKIDKDNNGTISKDELKSALQQIYSKNQLDDKVDKIFDFLDVNQSGSLDFSEFVAATCKLSDVEEKIRVAFDVLDKNKDGCITLDELFKFIGREDYDRSDCKEIFNQFDQNGDEKISFAEFSQAVQKYVNICKQIQY
ncbi:unnamed protein product [Paramecium pentaurelia]|uniref:non-specific serine/threonine protein kinase n=1 Tax=Paramecium pentaurelia TaxID=43138 RepID=A0A8S1T6S9_9CILI|nr:unnamed protein product [Paramecium pentaurelia]